MPRVVIPLTIALIASVAFVQFMSPTTSAASTRLRIDAPDSARVGEPVQILLWLRNAGNVAGYEATILFDSDAATFRAVEHRNNELNRMGRDVQTLGPDEFPGGVAIGAYSCSFAHCVEIAGLEREKRGGNGLVRLSTFTIVPLEPGPLTIELGSAMFVDVDGNVLNVALEQTVFTVQVVGE